MTVAMELLNERRVGLRFDEFPEKARANLLERITELTQELEDAVVEAEPEGATGKLRRETKPRVTEGPERITGSVSVTDEFAKAAALEYGAHGTTTVRAHVAQLNHVFARATSTVEVDVEEHTRRLNIAAHDYLRGPLAAMSGRIEEELKAAIDDAIAQGES